jgi:hypothetical protein
MQLQEPQTLGSDAGAGGQTTKGTVGSNPTPVREDVRQLQHLHRELTPQTLVSSVGTTESSHLAGSPTNGNSKASYGDAELVYGDAQLMPSAQGPMFGISPRSAQPSEMKRPPGRTAEPVDPVEPGCTIS